MDSNAYRHLKTSRGFHYHYYVSTAHEGKPTLLLLHGFPSTSHDWSHQIDFFKEEGYGLIVPDLLGYGGTDKPTNPEDYGMRLMSRDIIDILDKEKIHKVVTIGHDWGASLVSRLATYFPERFYGFGFLSVSYMPPNPNFDIDEVNKQSEEKFGYATFGYWKFFNEDHADRLIAKHPESFVSAFFPSDPKLWITDVAPVGALKSWVERNEKTNVASFVTKKLFEEHVDIAKEGLAGGLCWYKAFVRKTTAREETDIPQDKYTVRQPVFFAAALQDYISRADAGKALTKQYCPDATVVDFDTDHWVQLAAPEKLNHELLKWVKGIVN